MTDYCYIVFTRHGIDRMNKKFAPKLHAGEFVVCVQLQVPEETFKPREIPQVTLVVDGAGTAVLPEIAIDAADPDVRGMEASFAKQARINQAAAKLLTMAVQSRDVETQAEALRLLDELREHGVEVRVEVPDGSSEEVPE